MIEIEKCQKFYSYNFMQKALSFATIRNATSNEEFEKNLNAQGLDAELCAE